MHAARIPLLVCAGIPFLFFSFLFHAPRSPSCSFLFHFMNRDGRLYYGFHFKYSAGSVPHLPLLL